MSEPNYNDTAADICCLAIKGNGFVFFQGRIQTWIRLSWISGGVLV